MSSDYPTTKVLEFLVDVLEEPQRSTASDLHVIPVVVKNDLPSLLSLLTEVCRYSGVPFLTAEQAVGGIDWTDATKKPDPILTDKIEGIALDPTGSGSPATLEVRVEDELLMVRAAGSGTPTNPGDRNQFGLFTALLSPEIHSHASAVIAYDETDMSEDVRERAWNFVVRELQALGPGCKTLVVLVGCASLNYERHCQEGAGARWAFEGGSVRWRQRHQTDKTGIAKLCADDDVIVLMLGAGASASSNLPLGNELRNEALARQFPDLEHAGSSTRDQAVEFFHHLASIRRLMADEQSITEDQFVEQLTLERVLREEVLQAAVGAPIPTLAAFDMRQKGVLDSPGSAMVDIRHLLHLRKRLVLLTVNFDQMIEHTSTLLKPGEDDPLTSVSLTAGHSYPASVRMFVRPEDFKAFPEFFEDYKTNGGAVPLVKLHGTIDQLDTVRANLDDTLPGLDESAATLLRSLIPAEGASVKWVYVGCSMRDPDITAVTQTQQFAHRAVETWVSPFVDQSVERWVAQYRLAAWRSAKLPETLRERAITQTADTFFSYFRAILLP